MSDAAQPVRLDVSTPDVALLALDLQRLADAAEDLSRRSLLSTAPDTLRQELSWLRASISRVARELRRDAEDVAHVGLSYLAGDTQARHEFEMAWNQGSALGRIHPRWTTSPLSLERLGLGAGPMSALWGLTTWTGTAIAAARAFTSPTTSSVWTLRSFATQLGIEAGGRTPGVSGPGDAPSLSAAGPTSGLAAGMSTLTGPRLSAPPVTATRVSFDTCAVPTGYADLITRIPLVHAGGGQVRVDRIGSTAIVYIGGTVSASLDGGREPWDMSSNIAALAGSTSDSERGVRTAMRMAGVQEASRVILVGHSQGALVAQRLAADSSLPVTDVVTVGAPVQPGGIPAAVRVTTIENANDPIPALGGSATLDSRDVSVRRLDEIPASGDGLAAHHLEVYTQTARAMDDSSDAVLSNNRRELVGNLVGSCQTSLWRAKRAR